MNATDLERLYGESFYESLRETTARSAATVVPVLVDILKPRSVIDVGCGDGAWLAAFADLGVEDLTGIDGVWAQPQWGSRPGVNFLARDLAEPFELDRRFDLVLCLEVAEHLPSEAARGLVEELTRLSSVVVFSAAIPHQGGDGHLNEEWASYWSAHFAKQDFECAANLRWRFWADERVAFWYRQNLLCFVAKTERELIQRLRTVEAEWAAEPKDVVHPTLFLRYCRDLEVKVEHAEQLANTLAQRDQDVAREHAELVRLREDSERAQDDLRAQITRERADLVRVREDCERAQSDLRTEIDRERAALVRVREGFERAQSELRAELARDRADLVRLREDFDHSQASLQIARDDLASTRDELADRHADLISERATSADLRAELQEIKGSRSWRLVERMWRLRTLLRLP